VASEDHVREAADKLASLCQGDVEVDGRMVSGRVPKAGRAVPGLLRDIDRAGIDLDAIEVHRPTLDDVFLTLTGRSLRDAETSRQPEAPDESADPDVPQEVLR
jgi:ABC-2 type transport system ATP-binding protein